MINIFIMFLWSFILRAIPFREVIFGALCVSIICFGICTYNNTMEILENGVMLTSNEVWK